jgi:diaminohydroxyphosphoribosylaminopyrimidine deaminase/5-amino-6-(5-phosphoribosylamino)uracil reductase
VEGGAGLLGSVFRDDLVDEVWAFLAPKIIGADGVPAIGGLGLGAISAAPVLRDLRVEPIGDDLLVRAHAGRWQPPGFE